MFPNDLVQKLRGMIEGITGGVSNINSDHAAIHLGYGLNFSIYETLTTEQVLTYSFKAPTALYAHIKNISLQALGGSVKLELLAGVAVTVDTGVAVPITNLNDNSTFVNTSTIKKAPTFTGGTADKTIYALSDATNQSTGIANLAQNPNQEYVTKSEDTYYIIKITNLTTNNVPIAISGFFYEEPQGLV